jgi:3',5'-cyclic AMP phosphodiesterase CpdA
MESQTETTVPDSVDAFFHVADLHFWKLVWNPLQLCNKRFLGNLNVLLRRRYEYAMERAESFAESMAESSIRQMILTGDFTSTSTHPEFKRAAAFVSNLRRRGFKLTLMPGNHDVYTFESVRVNRFEEYFPDHATEGGQVASRALAGGTPLLVVPTVCPNVFSSKGLVNDAVVAQAARALTVDSRPILVAGHYPLLHETYAYQTPPSRQLRNADALRRVLGECGRQVLYMAGHVHRFSYVTDFEYPNLRHLTTETLFRTDRKNQSLGGYSEVHRTSDTEDFRVFRHHCPETWQREEVAPCLSTAK